MVDKRELITLQRQYYALVAPYLLHLTKSLAAPVSQTFLVDHILLDTTAPEPEPGYRWGFWRRVLPVIEAGVRESDDPDAEVDERIYEAVAELMVTAPTAGPSTVPQKSYKTFIYDLPSWVVDGGDITEARVTLLEEQVAVQAGTTGLRTWTASLHLAHHLLYSRAALFQSDVIPPIIELGAGTGFLSAVLAQLGADVISTDLGDDSDDSDDEGGHGQGERRTPLARLRANLALNNLTRPPTVRALDWADAARPWEDRPRVWEEAQLPVGPEQRLRTVVAADVIYDPELVPLLVETISVLVKRPEHSPSAAAILAATVRNEDTFAHFLAQCAKQSLHTELLKLMPMDQNDPTFWDTALDAGTRVEIVRVTRRTSHCEDVDQGKEG